MKVGDKFHNKQHNVTATVQGLANTIAKDQTLYPVTVVYTINDTKTLWALEKRDFLAVWEPST